MALLPSVIRSPSKKSLRAAEQKRADVARARRRWIREQGTLDTTRLGFIDETAANTKMVRLSGRCLRRNGMTAPCVLDGSMTGKTFLAYVEQCLVPTLKRNDIVVIDNLPGAQSFLASVKRSKRAAPRSAILPQYSPDLNPIEMPFSKLKACLRRVAERTVPRLYRRIGSFARSLTAQEARDYFRHAGYA